MNRPFIPPRPAGPPRTDNRPQAAVVAVQPHRLTEAQEAAFCLAGIWPPHLTTAVEVIDFYREAP